MARREGKPTQAQTKRRQAAALKRLDKALARTAAGRGILARVAKQRRSAESVSRARQTARDAETRRGAAEARSDYQALLRAVRAEGGIRPNRDYRAGDFPAAARGRGMNAPDEIVERLKSHGYHYDRDDDLIEDLRRRQAHAADVSDRARRSGVTRKGGESIRERIRRNWLGEYAGKGSEDNSRKAFRSPLGRFREP